MSLSNELTQKPDIALGAGEIQVISTVVQQIVGPVMANIGEILERNSQAMERIAATQQMMSARISDLEKQVRLKTPLSRSQEKCINDAIKARAREVLDAKGLADDRRAVTRIGGFIRKSVLARYGVDSLREAPAYDYETALAQVKGWMDLLVIRDVAKEAKKRAEQAALQAAAGGIGMDGAPPLAGQDD